MNKVLASEIISLKDTRLFKDNLYQIGNEFTSHLYDLYTSLDITDDGIIIEVSKDMIVEELYDISQELTYRDFGIYFIKEDEYNVISEFGRINNLLIIPSIELDDLERFNEFCNRINGDYTHVLFEYHTDPTPTIEQLEEIQSYYMLLKTVLGKTLKLLNNFSIKTIDTTVALDTNGVDSLGLTKVDITDLFLGINMANDYATTVNDLLEIEKSISELDRSNDIIYMFDSNILKSKLGNSFYKEIVEVAGNLCAYCTLKYSMTFFGCMIFNITYISSLSNLRSPSNMFLSDYIMNIKLPVIYSVYAEYNRIFTKTLNLSSTLVRMVGKDEDAVLNTNIRFVGIQVDKTSLELQGDVVSFSAPVKAINPINHNTYFNINTGDKSLDSENASKLSNFLGEFQNRVTSTDSHRILKLSVFDLFNCMFVDVVDTVSKEYKGRYIVFLQAILGSYSYTVTPSGEGYLPFIIDEEINTLYHSTNPVTSIPAYRKLLSIPENITQNKFEFRVPDYSLGIIINSLVRYKPTSDDYTRCGLTVEQIGVWSRQSKSLRGNTVRDVTNKISIKALRAKGMVTCFSGPNPLVSSIFSFSAKNWIEG